MVSKRALEVLEKRKAPVASYYNSWKRWLPIMKAYEEGRAAYFATRELCSLRGSNQACANTAAPVQLVYSFRTALKAITEQSPSLEERFKIHKDVSNKFKDALAELGCGFVPTSRDISANGMTAVRYPKGITAADVLGPLAERDIVVAGGLHKDIASEYFRVGHMGITATDSKRGDIEKILSSVKEVFEAARAKKA